MSLSSFHSFVHRARVRSLGSLTSLSLVSVASVASIAPLAIVAGIVAFAPACGGDDDSVPPPSTTDAGKDGSTSPGDASTVDAGPSIAPTGPFARFTLPTSALPNFLDVPFPSDVYLGTNHFVTESIPAVAAVITQGSGLLTHELAKENGFSRISPALFWIDDAANGDAPAPVDKTTLPANETACASATSSVFLVDLAPASGGATLLHCRARYHDDGATKAARPGLGIGPARGLLLQEGHAYAAVLTSRVKDTSGKPLAASLDFQDAENGKRTDASAVLYQTAIAKVKTALASALASDGATVVAVAPYTTSNQSSQLFTLRDTVEAQPAPTLAWDAATMAPMGAVKFAGGATVPTGYTATLDALLGPAPIKNMDGSDSSDASLMQVAHDKIASLGTAVFTAPNYLQSKVGGNSTADNATFNLDANGNIIPDPTTPTAKIWATITIPVGTMPAAGWPVVIAQHGLGQSRSFVMTLANTYAARGWATVAIDSVTFGARAPEAMYRIDQTNTWVADPGATYTGPDGFADLVGANALQAGSTNGATDFFGGLKNLGAIRDQLRQAMIDAVELVKMVRANPDVSPLAIGASTPKLDGTNIVYIGNSLGAMEAVGAAALEPNVKAWTLNVGGGGVFTELASHGPTVASSFLEAGGEYFGLQNDTLDEAHPLVVVAQNLVEPGDPIDYAPFLVTSPHTLVGAATKPRNILQVEVIYDELVSNEADEALARAAGYGMATPNVGSNSGVTDLADLTKSVDPVPLAQVNPASDGSIHDTPSTGYTAVLVQQSPGEHGSNLVESVSQRTWKIPYMGSNEMNNFVELPTANDAIAANSSIPCSYLEIQTAIDGFFSSALAGGVPTVAGFKTPVRDADGDGTPDATDANPLDPTVH